MSYSPWGAIQDSTQIEKGVRWVSTASHGGLMLTNEAAKSLLTPRALEAVHCTQSSTHVCFEEDCEYAIAFFEHPEWKRFLDQDCLEGWKTYTPSTFPGSNLNVAECVAKLQAQIARTDYEIREEMRAIVQRWNPEYFGLPNKCGGCDAELPPAKGYGFVLCDICEAGRRPSKQVTLFPTGKQVGLFEE